MEMGEGQAGYEKKFMSKQGNLTTIKRISQTLCEALVYVLV